MTLSLQESIISVLSNIKEETDLDKKQKKEIKEAMSPGSAGIAAGKKEEAAKKISRNVQKNLKKYTRDVAELKYVLQDMEQEITVVEEGLGIVKTVPLDQLYTDLESIIRQLQGTDIYIGKF